MAQPPQIQPCRYKTGKTLGAGSYSVVKECVHIETGRYYAAKVINKRLMAGREHMVRFCLSGSWQVHAMGPKSPLATSTTAMHSSLPHEGTLFGDWQVLTAACTGAQ